VRHRIAALTLTVLTVSAALTAGTPASAAEPGTRIQLSRPSSFPADGVAREVTAVVSTDARRDCRKVRWSMLLRVQGVTIDQVRFARVENDTAFPLRVEANTDTARITDVRFDPGSLCRGRTVTASYRFAFRGGPGTVSFQVQATDRDDTLLASADGRSEIAAGGDSSAEPSPSPSESASGAPETPAGTDPGTSSSEPAAGGGAAGAAGTPVAQNKGYSLLGPGLIVGALLVFLGIGMLLWLRGRRRHVDAPAQPWYPAP
jgi:hypothetical protein